jgi:hypothetical protein
MYFDDPDYGRAPALVVLRQYFTELETMIFAAEKQIRYLIYFFFLFFARRCISALRCSGAA